MCEEHRSKISQEKVNIISYAFFAYNDFLEETEMRDIKTLKKKLSDHK